jgi:hypothetical protein
MLLAQAQTDGLAGGRSPESESWIGEHDLIERECGVSG